MILMNSVPPKDSIYVTAVATITGIQGLYASTDNIILVQAIWKAPSFSAAIVGVEIY